MKVVVTIAKGCNELFEGEHIQAINKLDHLLIIKQGKTELGVFQTWMYWRVEE